MHRLATIPNRPTIAEVRALVREDGSSLLDDVTDAQIDKAIQQNIERPAVTPSFLASSAVVIVEFDVLSDKLRAAVADGSVLDSEPATDEELRTFRRASPPHFDNPVLAYAQEVAGLQHFLGRRLFTLASDIVIETGADIDAPGRALAVGAALCSVAAFVAPMARSVIDAMPADEWSALRESRLRAWMHPVRPIADEQPAA